MKATWKSLAHCALLLASLAGGALRAEPYFAVREGLKCMSCHFSETGGGMRNAFGAAWAQTALPRKTIEAPPGELWTGSINRFISVGANLRARATYTDVPNAAGQSAFETEEMRVYAAAHVLPGRIDLYVDQRIAPGGSVNLESYVRYTSGDQRWRVKAGQFYPPYGLRLEDDSAFIRQVTGVNFNTPDRGVELGYESGRASAQLAVTNGAPAGAETDEGKQLTTRFVYVQPAWRAGLSYNWNHTDAGDRRLHGVFAGLRTGPLVWLAEADYIDDETLGDGREQWVGLLEADWLITRGINLKATAEFFEPDADVDEDEQNRYSIVLEHFPAPFLQLRAGARLYDGIPQNDLQNRRIYFLSAHGYF